MRRLLAFCLLLGLGACGSAASNGDAGSVSGSGGSVASTPTTTSSGSVTSTVATVGPTTTVGLTALPDALLHDPLVRFQADWYCQTSKTAYASATDIDSALGVRLASAGIDRAAYDTFVASLGVDNLMRAGVLQIFLQTCR